MKLLKELQNIACSLRKISAALEPKRYPFGCFMVLEGLCKDSTSVSFETSKLGWRKLRGTKEFTSFYTKLMEINKEFGDRPLNEESDVPAYNIRESADDTGKELSENDSTITFLDGFLYTVNEWDEWTKNTIINDILTDFEKENFTIGQLKDFISKLESMAHGLNDEAHKYDQAISDAIPFRETMLLAEVKNRWRKG